jgi:hypothetical protein
MTTVKTVTLNVKQCNYAVARALGLDVDMSDWLHVFQDFQHYHRYEEPFTIADYCNDWGAAGPIMFKHGIGVYKETDSEIVGQEGRRLIWEQVPKIEWTAIGGVYHAGEGGNGLYGTRNEDPNPLLAAMRVFLMLQVGETIDLPEGLCL